MLFAQTARGIPRAAAALAVPFRESADMKSKYLEFRQDPQAFARKALVRGKTALPNYFPILVWLPKYEVDKIRFDLIGGLTVWGMTVPTALAYAVMAGVPAQAGLYAAMAALFAYTIFGTSRHMKVTASSTMAIMSASVVATLAGGDPVAFAQLTAMLALIIGVMLLVAGIIRLGFIADFLSKPVVTGFVFGLALVIAVGQAPKLFGVPSSSGNFFEQAWSLLANLDQTNPYTLAISIFSIVLLILIKKFLPKIPSGLVVLAVSILVTTALDLAAKGVSIVGEIPTGLPEFGFPQVDLAAIPFLIAGAAGIVFLAVGESLGTARAYASKYHYPIDQDQELIALGAANFATSISQGFAVDASLSTTATSENSGARTQLSSLVTSGMLLLTILFLAPLFTNLPNAVLGALVITSVTGLLDLTDFRRYWHARRTDLIIAVTALIGVITTDVLTGMMLAVLLSVIMVIYRASRPYIAILGRLPGARGTYGDIGRHPENTTIPGLVIFRLDAPLYFFNSSVADKQIRDYVKKTVPPPQAILIDLGASADLDIVSSDMLNELVGDMRADGIEVLFSQVRGAVRDRLRKTGAMDTIGENSIFLSVDAAVEEFSARHPESLSVELLELDEPTAAQESEAAKAPDSNNQ